MPRAIAGSSDESEGTLGAAQGTPLEERGTLARYR